MILFRLIKDKRVVGYEKHVFMGDTISICHIKNLDDKTLFSTRINHRGMGAYILHDRKDRYTEVKIGEQMLFEGDTILIPDTYTERIMDDGSGPQMPDNHILPVIFDQGAFGVNVVSNNDIFYKGFYSLKEIMQEVSVEDIKIIGAIGVDK